MNHLTLTAAAALILAAAPVLAQTTPPQAPATSAAPGSEEWLRLRGETYHAASDAEQDPAEVAMTARLNAEIAARNAAAEDAELQGSATFEADEARWREETARIETQRAQWEADNVAAEAARARYEQERAAWEAAVAACERAGRHPCAPAPGI